LVFGWLSRRCERQADLCGVQAVASGRVVGDGHPLAAGVNAMTRALEKVAVLNDMDTGREKPGRYFMKLRSWFRDWQHGSIADRVDFLQTVIHEPELVERTHRRVRWIRVGLIVALLVTLLALGQRLGWMTLAQML
jgi:STE24 endopeptidase